MFMMKVAKEFLNKHKDWKWVFTTSAKELRSNDQFIVDAIKELDKTEERFIVKTDMTKDGYYDLLNRASIQLTIRKYRRK